MAALHDDLDGAIRIGQAFCEVIAEQQGTQIGVPGSVTYGCVMVGMGMLALLALAGAWRTLREGLPAQHADDAALQIS